MYRSFGHRSLTLGKMRGLHKFNKMIKNFKKNNNSRSYNKVHKVENTYNNKIEKKKVNIDNIKKENPEVGDIWMVELQPSGNYCLHGNHFCVILDKIGSNYRIAPITINKNNIHIGEFSLPKGKFGLYKDSKLVLHQIRPISIETLKYKFNKVDNETLRVIAKYLIHQGRGIFPHAA